MNDTCPICKLEIPEWARTPCRCRGGDGAPIKWITREELKAMYPTKEEPT